MKCSVRTAAVVVGLAMATASCGNGELTLTEYAQEVESLTTTMYDRLERLTEQLTSSPLAVEDVQSIYSAMANAFRELQDGLQALGPPREAAQTHRAALELAAKLTEAGEAFARRADQVGTEAELNQLFAGPEARAFETAQGEIVAFCRARQAEFDATADREGLVGVPWIPTDMQEVVLVAFGCETEYGGS